MSSLYIGLMSGTSLDGVDGVLVDFDPAAPLGLIVRSHVHRPFAAALVGELLALNTPGENELHRAALACNALALVYADVVSALLAQSGVGKAQVRAVGAHGQTVRHRPGEFDGTGYTVQLNAPALLAERTGLSVVADFRSRDLAAGGQGAPLVPTFHRAMFGHAEKTIAVLNVGGFSNLSLLAPGAEPRGLDCGPGNTLLDHWCQTHTGQAFDRDGAWAASGTVIAPLLASMQSEPFFAKPAPKSTGRDHFNPTWLQPHLKADAGLDTASPAQARDVQATLVELSAWCAATELNRHGPTARSVWVCGGGAQNGFLLSRLRAMLPQVSVQPIDAAGLGASQVEACAFAWLAREHVLGRPGNASTVTGAAGPRVLGAHYPAG